MCQRLSTAGPPRLRRLCALPRAFGCPPVLVRQCPFRRRHGVPRSGGAPHRRARHPSSVSLDVDELARGPLRGQGTPFPPSLRSSFGAVLDHGLQDGGHANRRSGADRGVCDPAGGGRPVPRCLGGSAAGCVLGLPLPVPSRAAPLAVDRLGAPGALGCGTRPAAGARHGVVPVSLGLRRLDHAVRPRHRGGGSAPARRGTVDWKPLAVALGAVAWESRFTPTPGT